RRSDARVKRLRVVLPHCDCIAWPPDRERVFTTKTPRAPRTPSWEMYFFLLVFSAFLRVRAPFGQHGQIGGELSSLKRVLPFVVCVFHSCCRLALGRFLARHRVQRSPEHRRHGALALRVASPLQRLLRLDGAD